MIIANYMNDSFQEYRGKFPLVLFSYGCNLSCPKCYNKYVAVHDINQTFMGFDAKKVIDKNLTPLNKSVVFLGGEPTIWDDLPELCKYVKDKGLKVKVYTNGMKPEMIEALNRNKLVDAYSVDFKALIDVKDVIGLDLYDLEYVGRVCRTVDDIVRNGLEVEIRTTKWDTIKELDQLIRFVESRFPNIPHILQDDMLKNKPVENYINKKGQTT